jgi:hypothetical protein
LAIAIGNNGRITGSVTTNHNKDDRSQIKELLKNVRKKEVLADPGYDGENIAGVTFFLYFRFKSVAKYMYKLLQSDKTHFTF